MKRRVISLLIVFATFLAVTAVATPSHAGFGQYRFCGKWEYQFSDQNLGEDSFKYTGTFGTIEASHTLAVVYHDDAWIWWGYLDANGCTPGFPGDPGVYTFSISAQVTTPNGASALVLPQANGPARWFAVTRTLAGTGFYGATYTSNHGMGDTTASVGSLLVAIARRNDLMPGPALQVYTEVDTEQALYNGNVVLGHSPYLQGTNNWFARLKTVAAHELGHAVQDRLFGMQSFDYNEQQSNVELCNCNHLDFSGLAAHCLQSREPIAAAQTEGFAHFYAASLFNAPIDFPLGSHPKFAYYKEVRFTTGGNDSYPPVVVNAHSATPWNWMENKGCVAANAGTEIDWLSFFYELNTRTADRYTLSQIADVFRGACGTGSCAGRSASWSALQTSANALFGASSTKAMYWAQMGDRHGVNL